MLIHEKFGRGGGGLPFSYIIGDWIMVVLLYGHTLAAVVFGLVVCTSLSSRPMAPPL